MKKIFLTLFILGALLMSATAQVALNQPYTAVAVGSTNGATTLSWVIVPCMSANGGVPIVTYVNATSDKAGSVIQFYKVDAVTEANYASTTTSVPVSLTNGFPASEAVIIRHKATDTYEKATVTTFTSGTNLTLTAAPWKALAVGDSIYHITKTGVSSIPVGNATKELNGPGIFAGQRNMPLYAEIDATTSGTFNAICVLFSP